MKSLVVGAMKIGPLTLLVLCGALFCQAKAARPSDNQAPDPGASSSSGQSNTPPKGVRSDDTFIIGVDDVLSISVWKEAELTRQIPVRSDGKISLPLVGEVQAAGRTPLQLEQDITARLQSFITDPQVTVIVQQINSEKFNILGEVTKPGAYPLMAGTTIVDAIAIAGGLRDFAKKKGIYVLRQSSTGTENKYFFNYADFLKGKNIDQNIKLRPRDTVVVP
jgi:polysaccharide biosynthesis/export protein